MLDFFFSEEHKMLQQNVRRFVDKELLPTAKQRSKESKEYLEVRKKLADIGYLGMNTPEKYGGQPSDFISIGIVVEELARSTPYEAVMVQSTSLIYRLLSEATEEIRQRWLPRMTIAA